MALFKITLKEGKTDPVVARDYCERADYTIFQTDQIKDVAIETRLIERIEDITNNPPRETFTPFAVDPPDE